MSAESGGFQESCLRARSLFALGGAFVLAVAGAAQQPPPASVARVDQARDLLARGAYLEATDCLRTLGLPRSGEPDPLAFGLWRDVHPFIGGVLDPATIRSEPVGELDPARAERFRRARLRDALREIRRRASQTQIVILNESHNSPRDRAFALEVARILRPLGYSYLAVETLAHHPDPDRASRDMAELRRDGYPRLTTGFYTADPIFGDFLRQSLALGYRPIAYEWSNRRVAASTLREQIGLREQTQAENLAQIWRRDPAAKVLIHVGYSHAAEVPLPAAEGGADEWMASRLKRIAGIDPLTIDQTLIDETRPRHLAYRNLVSDRMDDRPVILFLEGRPLIEGSTPGAYDLQVIHPPLRLVRGRPHWLWRIGRKPVRIPTRLLPGSGRRLIQAFAAAEPSDAIPLDQLVVEAGRPAPPLMVPRRVRLRWAFQDPRTPPGCRSPAD